MNELGVIAILGAIVILIVKFKGLFFKAKDNKLVKEDQALKDEQQELEKQIQETKDKIGNHPVLSVPEVIEEFWKKK